MNELLPVDGLAVEVDGHSLAFVLNLVEGRADIAGLDNERLSELLADGEAFAEGRRRLAEQGLVIESEEGVDVDPRLLYFCAVLAAPTATVEARSGDRSVTFHVASDQIVEVTRIGADRYQLAGFTDLADLGTRAAAFVAEAVTPA